MIIHGIGVGDINSDGRQDIVVPTGWYEQPPKGSIDQPWTFHAAEFGNGGGEIGVYDVNGDKLTDIVTSMAAHDFGLAWFEQKKARRRHRTLEKHDDRRGLLDEERRRRDVSRSRTPRALLT